ncbi:right-handed parallel beta-helix repeat-containing protein [Cryobacterium sp. CG_9.6]|uniref:right-handed parallel beta-helix repeat-containing protein n=1 Tax=Cryobacterium sp. CG_9.6 TaxID=2760710 RepID=UPI00247417C9|nr:right-handed parallel beta-helix repeat-containing protein [Cryobacterium sp. CG_9.6]MDH6235377.1 hypothetical protein [Cryobacterium sp. CG_9.6]
MTQTPRRQFVVGIAAALAAAATGAKTVPGNSVPNEIQPSSSDEVISSLIDKPESLTRRVVSANYAPLVAFNSNNYASINEMFRAVNSFGRACEIEIVPGQYVVTPLRIDSPDVRIIAYGATLRLAAGTDQILLSIGVNAVRFNAEGITLDGNYTAQLGTSHCLVFEEYFGLTFRYADRSNIINSHIINALTDGARIEAARLQIQFRHVTIRDFGRYGWVVRSTDCAFSHGGIGGIRGQVGAYIDGGANWVRDSGIWSNSKYGIQLTRRAASCLIVHNSIDNNIGAGLGAIGAAGSSLNTLVSGNLFRGNSTAGIGLHPDIYLEEVAALSFLGNFSGASGGSSARTSYAIQTGNGVGFINEIGNYWASSTYHVMGRFSNVDALRTRLFHSDIYPQLATDVALRSKVASDLYERFRVRGDGEITWGTGSAPLDTNLYRAGRRVLRTDGAIHAESLRLHGAGGAGFILFEVPQTASQGLPSAGQARAFARLSNQGRPELVFQTSLGEAVFTPQAGTSSQRPPASNPGQQYYDTTLKRPIWSDGTTWRDAAGRGV